MAKNGMISIQHAGAAAQEALAGKATKAAVVGVTTFVVTKAAQKAADVIEGFFRKKDSSESPQSEQQDSSVSAPTEVESSKDSVSNTALGDEREEPEPEPEPAPEPEQESGGSSSGNQATFEWTL